MGQESSKAIGNEAPHRQSSPDNAATQPPIRLRMHAESDQVAMEVKWCEDGSKVQQRWCSDEDNFCTPWDSTKLLPSSATNISVQFYTKKVETVEEEEKTEKIYVLKANAKNHSESASESATSTEPEVIELRMSPKKAESTRGINNSIDAMFTIAGSGSECHLKSAWNAAGEPRSWEVCDEDGGRPEPSEPLPVLVAADETPAPPPELGNNKSAYVLVTNRFVAALRALQQVRKDGMAELEDLDAGLTGQWWGVNIANSCSFCCDSASALTVIPCPLASIITGFCSATITTTTWSLDTVFEAKKNTRLRDLLYWMMWNCIAVQELEKKWQAAKKVAEGNPSLSRCLNEGLLGSQAEYLRTVTGNTFCITFDTVSSSCSIFKVCPVMVPLWLTWVGAVGCFMVAANGWLTTKQMQETVRDMAIQLAEATKVADEHLEKFMADSALVAPS